MNGPLKRAAVACLLMFGLLMININYLQGVRAEELREDARNTRNFYARYEIERGRITAGNKVLAESVDTGDSRFRFQRRYPEGEVYAHVTGFFLSGERVRHRGHARLPAGRQRRVAADPPQPRPVHEQAHQGRQRRPDDRAEGAGGRAQRAAPQQQARRGRRARPEDGRDLGFGVAAHLRPEQTVEDGQGRRLLLLQQAGQGQDPAAAQPRAQPDLPARLDVQGHHRCGVPGGRLQPRPETIVEAPRSSTCPTPPPTCRTPVARRAVPVR